VSDAGPVAAAPRVGVVIPYYQRSPGLLARAIDSVFAQEPSAEFTIIVVDDSSPNPAERDLEALDARRRAAVHVERQPNAGPGAARNTGLEALPTSCELVAFLDSDDVWLPGHIARAVSAFRAGYDFFFSNFLDVGESEAAFESRRLVSCRDHEPIAGADGCYSFGRDLCTAILERCPIETSTVVLRRDAFAHLRFRQQFRRAYEDLMFWYEAAALNRPAAFSIVPGCQYGTGVNIYRGIADGSVSAVRALAGAMEFHRTVRETFRLTSLQRDAIEQHRRRNRGYLAYHVAHGLRRGNVRLLLELRHFLAVEPAALLALPWNLSRHLTQRYRGRASNPTDH
jgi:succinoglycan biosynthesis protein ExoW